MLGRALLHIDGVVGHGPISDRGSFEDAGVNLDIEWWAVEDEPGMTRQIINSKHEGLILGVILKGGDGGKGRGLVYGGLGGGVHSLHFEYLN